MNHLHGDIQRGLTGDEDDASPAVFHHPREVLARKTDSTQEIRLDDLCPVLIGDFRKWFRAIDAEVVHEDVHCGVVQREILDPVCGGEVCGKAFDPGLWEFALQSGDGFIRATLSAAVDHYAHSLLGQTAGDGESDSGGGAGNNGELIRD